MFKGKIEIESKMGCELSLTVLNTDKGVSSYFVFYVSYILLPFFIYWYYKVYDSWLFTLFLTLPVFLLGFGRVHVFIKGQEYLEVHFKNVRQWKEFGINIINRILTIQYGKGVLTFLLPWSWKWKEARYEHTLPNGGFLSVKGTGNIDDLALQFDSIWDGPVHYNHILENGKIEKREVKYRVFEQVYTWRWLPFIQKIERHICLLFNKPIGKFKISSFNQPMYEYEFPINAVRRIEANVLI